MKGSLLFIFLIFLSCCSYGQSCPVSVSISPSSPAICSLSLVTLTATVSSGKIPYRYVWNTGETTAAINVNKAGTYTVSVSDNTSGCTPVVQSITLVNSVTPVAPTAADATTCPNGSATLTATAPGGNYQWYDSLVGGKFLASGAVYVTPPLTSAKTYYVETTIAQCTSSRTAVSVSIVSILNVTGASVCSGNVATLSARGATSYQWFDAPKDGNLVSSNATFTTPVLTKSTTYYVVGSGNGCVSNRTPVTAAVTPTPEAPVTANVSVCSGSSATLSVASPVNGVVIDWFDVPTGGTSLITSPDYTTPPLTASKTYYAQSSIGNCISARTATTVTVNAFQQAPVINAQTICSSTNATLTASGSSGVYQWYSSLASPAPLFSGPVFQTLALTETTTYYVQAVNGDCISQRTAVTVTVKPAIDAPSAAGQIVCSGSSGSLTAIAQNNATFEWYDAATGGTLLSKNAVYVTPPVTKNTTYYVQTILSGCHSLRTPVLVSVLQVPSAPEAAGITICSGSSTTLVATGSGNGFEWYNAANGGVVLSSTQAFTTPLLTATTTYYVQNMVNECASPRTAVTVTVIPIPAAPTAPGTTICPGTAATLTATGTGTIFEWYDTAPGGKLLATGSSFTTPILTSSTTYYVQNISGQCPSARTAVKVTLINVPTPGFHYSSNTFCPSGPNPAPVIDDPAGGTFSVTPAGLAIDLNTGAINLGTSTLGNYTVSFLSNGNCSTITKVQIAVVTSPNAQFLYQSPFCQFGPNSFPAYPGPANPGIFSVSPSGLIFTNPGTGEIDLTKSKPGNYTITNTIATSGSCLASNATGNVTIYPAINVNAGPNQTVLTGSKVQLAGTFSGAIGVTWSGGAGSFSNPASPNAVYTPAPGETSAFLTLTTNTQPGPCGQKSSAVTITINALPAAPVVQGAMVCSGNAATLIATAPGGNYQWFDAATGGKLLAANAAYITAPLLSTTSFYVETTIGNLTSNRTKVTVTVNPIPAAPISINAIICTGSTASLVADGPVGTYQWYDSATGGNLLSTSKSYTTPPLLANTSYFVQTSVDGCVSARRQVNVTVKPVPYITGILTGSICSGTLFSYAIMSNIPADYIWSRAAVPGISNTAVSNQTTGIISETLVNTTNSIKNVTYIIYPVLNGCTGSPVNLIVTVYPVITVTSAQTMQICNGASSNYSISFNLPPFSFSWSRTQVSGISNLLVSNQSAGTIREVLMNTTTAPVNVDYHFIINASGCAASVFDLIVTVYPVAHITSASSGTICGGVAQNYVIKSDAANPSFSWSRAVVPNISNEGVTNQVSGVITETLVNTGSRPVPVTYIITPSVNGCPGMPFKYITLVYPQSATAVANNNSPVCLNSTIKLFTSDIPGATFLWTGPNGFKSTFQNPTISNVTKANSGNYYLTINNYGCSNTIASPPVVVDDYPKAYAGPDQVICINTSMVKLDGIISGGTTTGVWSTSGTGTFSPASNQLNGEYIPSAQDKAIPGGVVLTLTSTSNDDCAIATSNMAITFQPLPTANAGGKIDACSQDLSIKLNGQATNATSVFWTTSGTGTFSPSANVAAPFYERGASDLQNGSVTLTFHASSTLCSSTPATNDLTINFIPPPKVDAGKEIYVIKGEPTVLTPYVSDNNVHYLWTPNSNINIDTIKNPAVVAYQDVTYTLKVTDSRGCVTQDQVSLIVITALTIPNTFTPNGDGINDVWNIPGLIKYPEVTVDVFTRAGQKVFHSMGYGIPWDGEYNGQRLPVGVYYYIIDTKFRNERLSGYVTIIR